MTAIFVLLFFVLLPVATFRWGADSRDVRYSLGAVVHPHGTRASRRV